MYNWAEICSELKDLEKRVDTKLDRLYTIKEFRYPTPVNRIQKGKELLAIYKAIRMFIEKDEEKDAAALLRLLLERKVKLKSVRWSQALSPNSKQTRKISLELIL